MEKFIKNLEKFIEVGKELEKDWDYRKILYYLDEEDLPINYQFDEFIKKLENMKKLLEENI